jgi:hypothetical protein
MHGSKPKLVHASRFERLTPTREGVMRVVFTAAAAVRPALVPMDAKQLAVSSGTVDSAAVSLQAAQGAGAGAGRPEPPPAAVVGAGTAAAGNNNMSTRPAQPSDTALPVPFPESLKALESQLGLAVVGAPALSSEWAHYFADCACSGNCGAVWSIFVSTSQRSSPCCLETPQTCLSRRRRPSYRQRFSPEPHPQIMVPAQAPHQPLKLGHLPPGLRC